jgi:hypothetical protein
MTEKIPRSPRGWIRLGALGLIWMSACGGKAAQSGSTSTSNSDGQDTSASATGSQDSDASTAPLPACGWPASLDPTDGSTGACVAARTYLACQGSNGDGLDCISNDLTQCPGPNRVVGETFSACKDECNANEYAVACGGPGPAPPPAPPSGCRSLPSGPGGGSISCCPCEPAETDPTGDVQGVSDDDGGSFVCGVSTCDGSVQICEDVQGGPPPGVGYDDCIPIPTMCVGDVTCTCVISELKGRGASGCSAMERNITVQIDVP